jgi:hypothetical protein
VCIQGFVSSLTAVDRAIHHTHLAGAAKAPDLLGCSGLSASKKKGTDLFNSPSSLKIQQPE